MTPQPKTQDLIHIERSIIKTYRKDIWSPFIRALKNYDMIQPGDRVCVCVSGGKDSMLLAKLLQELQRHGQFAFELTFMLADPGYDQRNLDIVIQNAHDLGIPLQRIESGIFEIVSQIDDGPCYLCARMRRGHLYSGARALGCNKIALGHHNDDVVETILMNLFYGSEVKTMMPKLRSQNFEGMELIRPLYYVNEQSIMNWRDHNKLTFINCACPLNDACEIAGIDEAQVFGQELLASFALGKKPNLNMGKRKESKNLLKLLTHLNPDIKQNILKSLDNVNLDAVVAYRTGGQRVAFLDKYDRSFTEEQE